MFNKIAVIFVFLFFIASISCVYAIQDNETLDNEDNYVLKNEIETIESNKSFTDLNNLINNESINEFKLDCNYSYSDDDSFPEGVMINRSLTIDGQGHTIDAKFKSRIFLINSSNVILKNIIFINGNGGMSTGGAICSDSNSKCNIINSTFINNKAAQGGVIWQNTNSTLFVSNSNFINNRALCGGVILCFNSSNNIQNSVFINNSANFGSEAYGGAIYYLWYSKGFVLNSTFINNFAYRDGGALLVSFDCTGDIINSTFINNYAERGGAINYYSGGNNIITSTFINNSASKNGGAIYFSKGSKNYIDYSNFTQNSAKQGGGIFYIDKTKGIINNSVFIENIAEYGGGIYYHNESTNSVVINSAFIRNYAENSCAMYGGTAYNCTILRLNSILVAESIISFYNDVKFLTIILKDSNHSPIGDVSINVILNNVEKTLKTDAKGQISIPTKDLNPNLYNVLVVFNGSDKFEKNIIESSILIKKAKVKITAKKKKFKAKIKNKKYSILIKDSKGKKLKKIKLTLKIKGKIFKAKTNAKGKATFKITKLTKKAKYKAVIQFKGSALYNNASKKIKIIVN